MHMFWCELAFSFNILECPKKYDFVSTSKSFTKITFSQVRFSRAGNIVNPLITDMLG